MTENNRCVFCKEPLRGFRKAYCSDRCQELASRAVTEMREAIKDIHRRIGEIGKAYKGLQDQQESIALDMAGVISEMDRTMERYKDFITLTES